MLVVEGNVYVITQKKFLQMITDTKCSLSWALLLHFRTLTSPPLKERLNRYVLGQNRLGRRCLYAIYTHASSGGTRWLL